MDLETNELFPVTLLNPTSYPIRALVWVDEDTGYSTFRVLKQFEKHKTQINRLTYEHLRRDPKIQVIVDKE